MTLIITSPSLKAQNVGIGTATPDYRLHVFYPGSSLLKLENSTSLATGVSNDLFFKTGTLFTGGIRTIGTTTANARLGFFTKASATETGLLERLSILDNGNVGLGTTSPLAPLHIITTNSNPVIIDGGNLMFLTLAEGGVNRGYIGSFAGNEEDVDFGTYSSNITGKLHLTIRDIPALTVDASGFVGIGTTAPARALHVRDDAMYVAEFENTNPSTSTSNVGAWAHCDNSPGSGTGMYGSGGGIGVIAQANMIGADGRIGLSAYGAGGTTNNYGILTLSNGGTLSYGIYANAIGGSTATWAGYFQGAVFAATYSSSDRKLKDNIQPLQDAMTIVNQLQPTLYNFRTDEYKQMNLPEGIHYGLIADEVQKVLPGIVKKAVQPEQYENNNIHGKKVSDPVEFNAINYSEIIPILVGAVKEQQAVIRDQKKKIDDLEARLAAIERKLQ
jgi:hypothetical protein